MNPTLPDLLTGITVALSIPLPPEASGEYAAGRQGMIATIAILCAQEAERGGAARVWENGAMRALFGRAAPKYDGGLGGRPRQAASGVDADFTWAGLDAANADLRRVLIALHEAVEDAGDRRLDREILNLYRDMARARRLDLAGG